MPIFNVAFYYGDSLGAPGSSDFNNINVYHLQDGKVLHVRKVHSNANLAINDVVVHDTIPPLSGHGYIGSESLAQLSLTNGQVIYLQQVTGLELQEAPDEDRRYLGMGG